MVHFEGFVGPPRCGSYYAEHHEPVEMVPATLQAVPNADFRALAEELAGMLRVAVDDHAVAQEVRDQADDLIDDYHAAIAQDGADATTEPLGIAMNAAAVGEDVAVHLLREHPPPRARKRTRT
jgi:hypothetical protein